jgi:5-oxoprolinase (ATP-hydrolysing) subunit A
MNADLGESFGAWTLGDDTALMEFISSANVACGFHAGDPLTLRRSCALAAERGVTIGAQVSYRDLAGFGRREMDVPQAELAAEILYQIAALDGIARAEGSQVRYVKPHGALYHRVIRDPRQAEALVSAVRAYDPTLPLLTRPGGQAAEIAGASGTRVVSEAYADRAYQADGSLVPRGQAGAVLTDPRRVAERAVGIVTAGTVLAEDGATVRVVAHSLCIHGDTAGAVELARAVRQALEQAGVTVAPFA